jgi:hypothetical protein
VIIADRLEHQARRGVIHRPQQAHPPEKFILPDRNTECPHPEERLIPSVTLVVVTEQELDTEDIACSELGNPFQCEALDGEMQREPLYTPDVGVIVADHESVCGAARTAEDRPALSWQGTARAAAVRNDRFVLCT